MEARWIVIVVACLKIPPTADDNNEKHPSPYCRHHYHHSSRIRKHLTISKLPLVLLYAEYNTDISYKRSWFKIITTFMHTINLGLPIICTIIRIDAVVSSLYKPSFLSKFVQYLLCIYLILLLS